MIRDTEKEEMAMQLRGICLGTVLVCILTLAAFGDVSEVFTSYQVNVVGTGVDFQGDAANEPSFAIDPTDLDTIAVGWRQFDSISAEYYYAGVAYSTDGGANWSAVNYVDVVAGEPKVSRSDPVLDYAADGTFYYYSLNRGFYPRTADLFISADGGQTWTMETEPGSARRATSV